VAELRTPRHTLKPPYSLTQLSLSSVSVFLLGERFELLLRFQALDPHTSHFSYLIIIKSLMPNVVAAIHHGIVSPDACLPDWAISPRVWICLIMLILAPLSFLRHLNSLRYTSFIALFAVGTRVIPWLQGYCADRWFSISVPYPGYSLCYFNPIEGTPEPREIHLIHFTPTFVSTFPVQVFAFTCAQNVSSGGRSVGAFIHAVLCSSSRSAMS